MNKVLVVDDDDVFRATMQAVLEDEGFEVWGAASGNEALDLLARPDLNIRLIFLDLYMPGMSGFQFAHFLRSQPVEWKKKIPIVVTSATSRSSEKEAAATFDGFLQKPFNLGKLIEICHQFCSPRVEFDHQQL